MRPIYKFVASAVLQAGGLGDRQIRVVASDPTRDRANDVLDPDGCRLDDFHKNPIVLANHDPSSPLGTAQAEIKNGRVEALITFAPAGISDMADQFCGLAKHGILNAVSVGFDPVAHQPIPGGGRLYTDWALLELSIVSVPANPNALVVERSASRVQQSRATSRPVRHRARDISEVQIREIRHRNEIIASGLKKLTGPALDAWLRCEFSGLDLHEAAIARGRRRESMTAHDRMLERVRESDFVDHWVQINAMSDNEHAEYRRGQIAALEPAFLSPMGRRFFWDPNADTATNSYNAKIWQLRGGLV